MKQSRACVLLAVLISTVLIPTVAVSGLRVASADSSAAAVVLVKAGRLLDPRTGNVLSPAAVLIEDGKIKEVGAPSQNAGTCTRRKNHRSGRCHTLARTD